MRTTRIILIPLTVSVILSACTSPIASPSVPTSSPTQQATTQPAIPYDLLRVGVFIPKVSFQMQENVKGTVQVTNKSILSGSFDILVRIDNTTVDEYKGTLQPNGKQTFPIVLKSDKLGTHRLGLYLSDGHTFYDTLLFHIYSSLKSPDDYEAIVKQYQPKGITVTSVAIDDVTLVIKGTFDPKMSGTLYLIQSFAESITASRQLTIPELSGVSVNIHYPEIDNKNFTFTLRIDMAPTGSLEENWTK